MMLGSFVLSTRAFLIGAAALALMGPAGAQEQRFPTQAGEVIVETVASGLEHPWGLAFMPDGRMLVTERPGRLRVVGADRKPSAPLAGVPRVAARGQGGLLDVALDPGFASNRLVYISYAEPREGGAATAVARAQLNPAATALQGATVLFRQEPAVAGGNHFGSRLAFDPEGNLFVTTGDRFNHSDLAQDPSNTIGKVVRIRPDGTIPPDNPGEARQDWAPEVWSIGHRNIQGAALRPGTSELWIAEHGARGGDEINHVRAGRNYGWPVISYGTHYSGAKIGEGTEKPGMEQPVFFWDPSIAPSGLAWYVGDAFPAWKGSLLVGALRGSMVVRLSVQGGRVTGEERLLEGLNERIRDVRVGPDGLVYLLTDAPDGRILRLRPASGAN